MLLPEEMDELALLGSVRVIVATDRGKNADAVVRIVCETAVCHQLTDR